MNATAACDRDAAILALAPHVTRLAARVSHFASKNAVCDKGDLESAGWLAAIRAVDSFDPARGVPLEGYAQRVILGAMFNELRRCDPVSERDRRTVRVGTRVRYELAHELHREPTLAEIEAKVPGFSRAVVRCHGTPRSMNESPAWCEDNFVFDLSIEGKLAGGDDVADIVIAHETSTEVHASLARLDERRRSVIASHYFEERPLREIARDFGVSAQRVSQLHGMALESVRRRLAVVA
jgi:RNA polymerase sigma factor for flagellar operon FliA